MANNADGDGLEIQKLQLEREKLAFEVRKFDEDQAKRELESTKLKEEVRELRRPWYQRPSYLGPIATITVAIIGGLIAFGTDVFKSNVVALRSERDQLSQNVKDLGSAKTKLSAENSKLSADNSQLRDAGNVLQRNVTTLGNKTASLLKDNGQLQNEKKRLSDEIVLTELKTHLTIIQSLGSSYNELYPTNQSLQSVLAIAERFGS